jgi:CRP-like cAMP-binding protein
MLDQPKALATWGFTKLLMFLTLYLHWVACFWHSISKDGWFSDTIVDFPVLDEINPYWVSLEASLHLTVGSSGLDTVLPTTDVEAAVQCALLVLGACIVASIFGNMASLISAFNADTTEYQRKISHTLTQLKQMQVPKATQEQARQYLEYTYQQNRWRPSNVLYDVLNAPLARKIYAFADRDVIMKAYLFSDSSEPFVNALIKHMNRITLQHRDHVITQGQAGGEMFFLRKGTCEVIMHGQFVNKLQPGCGFGEVAMVSGGRRTSTVRCLGICELSVLTRESLEKLTKEFPSEVVNVQQYAKTKIAQMKVMNRMTFLLARDKLSSETKALICISNCVARWKYKRGLRLAATRARATTTSPNTSPRDKHGAFARTPTHKDIMTTASVVHVSAKLRMKQTERMRVSLNRVREEQARKDAEAKEWEQTQRDHTSYKLLLQMAWVDGKLVDNGERILQGAKEKYGITDELHSKFLEEALRALSEVSRKQRNNVPGDWESSDFAGKPLGTASTVRYNVLPAGAAEHGPTGGADPTYQTSSTDTAHVGDEGPSNIPISLMAGMKRQRQSAGGDSSDSTLHTHVEMLHEEMMQESRHGLALVSGQVNRLEAKLDTLLAAMSQGVVPGALEQTLRSTCTTPVVGFVEEPAVSHVALGFR